MCKFINVYMYQSSLIIKYNKTNLPISKNIVFKGL